MKIVHSEKTKTTKYIHNDGTETSIKVSLSGHYTERDLDTPVFKDKNKYSIVISSSLGCQMKCKFCHLTNKNSCFKETTAKQLISNLKEAILHEKTINPDICDKYIKLCWMGMGEAILKPDMVKTVSFEIIDWALKNKLAIGVDGVDISTVMPKIGVKWTKSIIDLNTLIVNKYEELRNPINKNNRSLVRLFYSLHSTKQDKREVLIPNAQSIEKTISQLKDVNSNNIDVIFHYMFLNNINDSESDIQHLSTFLKENDLLNFEFRILRFNPVNDEIIESENLQYVINDIKDLIPNIKIQHSSGDDVASSCGQFIVESKNLKHIVSDLKLENLNIKIQHSSGEDVYSSCGQFIS